MAIGPAGGLAIAEIIFYVPALIVSLIVGRKHGFGRSGGWYFLIVLSLVRIAGGIAELVFINNPTDTSAAIAAIVLSSIGLTTLLAAALAMLRRM